MFTISLVVFAIWLIPVAVLVWAVITLHRIRTGQEALLAKVQSLERLLQLR